MRKIRLGKKRDYIFTYKEYLENILKRCAKDYVYQSSNLQKNIAVKSCLLPLGIRETYRIGFSRRNSLSSLRVNILDRYYA